MREGRQKKPSRWKMKAIEMVMMKMLYLDTYSEGKDREYMVSNFSSSCRPAEQSSIALI